MPEVVLDLSDGVRYFGARFLHFNSTGIVARSSGPAIIGSPSNGTYCVTGYAIAP